MLPATGIVAITVSADIRCCYFVQNNVDESQMLAELFKPISHFFGYLLLGYFCLLALVFALQRSLLYFPDKQKPAQNQLAALELKIWPSANNHHGYIGLLEQPEAAGTMIVFHGNAGAAQHRNYYLAPLANQNLRVILAEYPGYGGRSGTPDEQSLVSDGLEAIETAYRQFGSPIYLWGESLGAGVVASILSQTTVPIRGVALLTPWDTLPDVAQSHYWYLPAKWLVKDKYDSITNLKSYKGNVAIILAEYDEVIPVKHGERLYQSITANKRRWVMENAGHNSIPVDAHLAWWGDVIDFLQRTPPPSP